MTVPRLMCDGDPAAPLLVVGMSPGKEEVEQGLPFVGPSGRLLWSMAQRAGFTRADCYILNCIGEIEEDEGVPSPRQWNQYWDLFDEALSQSKARAALLLGGSALWRVTGLGRTPKDSKISQWRGYLIPPKGGGMICKPVVGTHTFKSGKRKGMSEVRVGYTTLPLVYPDTLSWIVPALHPSGIMRTGFKTVPALAYDVDRAWRASQGKLEIREQTSWLTAAPDLRFIGKAVAFDIETTRSLGGGDFIHRIGLAGDGITWTSPWNANAKIQASAELEIEGPVKVAHNLAYDLPRLRAAGVDVKGPYFDTMLACQLLQPDMPKGLNWVASLYLDTERWKHLSDREPAKYNALDAQRTLELYRVLVDGLKATGQYELFVHTIMPAVEVLIEMSVRGIKVDQDFQRRWTRELEKKERELRVQWDKTYPDVSPSSPAQLSVLLYQREALPPQHKEGGGLTTNAAALRRLADATGHLAPKFLLEMRRTEKLLTAFARVAVSADGCVHPSYVPKGKDIDVEDKDKGLAGTGRITAKEPNIQQIPKEARRLYIPHTPGNIIVEFDYDQAELRVVAALSGDAALALALDGPDLHAAHALRWNCPRPDAKTAVYCTLYGGGPAKLQKAFYLKGAKKTQKECQELQNQFFTDYPRVKAWRDQLVREVSETCRLVNPFSRHRYFWHTKEDVPAAMDFKPQSTVADIVWDRLVAASRLARELGGWILSECHDSFMFELPPDQLAHGVPRLKACLEKVYDNVAPGFYLPTTPKWGPSWGELTSLTFAKEGSEEEEELLI